MSSKKPPPETKIVQIIDIDPFECPFREFRDSELSTDYWGMGPSAFRAASMVPKASMKTNTNGNIWMDDQTQPLPRSVRVNLCGWKRAETLALERWNAETTVFEETNNNKMSVIEIQLSHSQVLLRSAFCRKVLSSCFILERVEALTVEHQWELFSFSINPEGWRARYLIYSPGMKSGGGQQHRPGLSKNGCYLVRLYYLGAWRCVWVNDQVPVDADDIPLLPFAPLMSKIPGVKMVKATTPGAPQPVAPPATIVAPVVQLWPLLLCKALLKLAAPDMNSDEDSDVVEDEAMDDFDILHSLTGCMHVKYEYEDSEKIWQLICAEVPVFSWDDEDNDTVNSTIKTKSSKKPMAKEVIPTRTSVATVYIQDTKDFAPFHLPGISPGHEMRLIVNMARDLPLKKPLPEPEVSPWKYFRWVDWARGHGLYEAYECPRLRYVKVNGLLKLSYAPHLLDVMSTESITIAFRQEHEKTAKKAIKDNVNATKMTPAIQCKEELKEWVLFDQVIKYLKFVSVMFYPSLFNYTTAGNHPPLRMQQKIIPNRALDIPVSKSAPLYIQIDGPQVNLVRISLNVIHPRVLMNCGIHVMDYIEPAHVVLEEFEWFEDSEMPVAKAYMQTRGYESMEVSFEPGRHFCRLWVHSRMNWQVAVLSESALTMGTRELIQQASVKECPWACKFLTNLGTAFIAWIRVSRSAVNIAQTDREFYKSYRPDLTWDPQLVGYHRPFVHWMFRQALQSLLYKRVSATEYSALCKILRSFFNDPDFGMPEKPVPPQPLRDVVAKDPCDCIMAEAEEEDTTMNLCLPNDEEEEIPLVSESLMQKLLITPSYPVTSQICQHATDELSCAALKEEREKLVRKHEAATLIQAIWRGKWARKCLKGNTVFTPDMAKCIMDNAFGNVEALSALMKEFFSMFPGTRKAYSVASALSGFYGLQQYTGISPVSGQCKWIPYFQGVFFCHAPVKVHLDINSTIPYCTLAVYNNDTGTALPQTYNAHITFDISPNILGYTIMGHGNQNNPTEAHFEVHWQLTVLSSVIGAFHICDNNFEHDYCRELPMLSSYKFHLDEIFIPNRRNILGGIQITVSKYEAISFRASASSTDLEMEAILRTRSNDGQLEEVAKCSGRGELYWPFIRLQSQKELTTSERKRSLSQQNLMSAPSAVKEGTNFSPRSQKGVKTKSFSAGAKGRSTMRLKGQDSERVEPKVYYLELVASNGWPLTIPQWQRVDDIRNTVDEIVEPPPKKTAPKEKTGKDKDRGDKSDKPVHASPMVHIQPGDAYVELECSLASNGSAAAKRDDERDLLFAAARNAWSSKYAGRNASGVILRNEFRTEFLEVTLPPPTPAAPSVREESLWEQESEGKNQEQFLAGHGPSPEPDSGILEISTESHDEIKYYTMPEQLKDKFIPLYFVPFCTKELEGESVILTQDIADAARTDRQLRVEAAHARMEELQQYNDKYILGQQKLRAVLIEKLFVDGTWNEEVADVLRERDEAIAAEALTRNLSATKKKIEAKKK